VTSGGLVLARAHGETAAKHVLGRYADLLRTWLRLVSAAGLSQCESSKRSACSLRKSAPFSARQALEAGDTARRAKGERNGDLQCRRLREGQIP
jgi:hypothetical protein